MAECCIKGCDKAAKSRGMCNTHYERYRLGRNVSPDAPKQHHGLSNRDRFEKYFTVHESGCWLWLGSLNNKGYGQFNLKGDRPVPAHRASWMIYKGEIPGNPDSAYKTQYVLHRCDNPKCVNPGHLFLGSQQGNMDDKMQKGRHAYGVSLGEKHGNARLTAEIVKEIRLSEASDAELSLKYGIARPTIYAARKGLTWKHVT
jgi:hypothetical protein